ncbi:MAG: riboflavin biosynthesis protein RibF [Clostridiales bacterium]|nr:riboflavin biosynthesis protein RibF [Clostridiales bacterium]
MAEDKKRAIALGFFDGVHIGHSALLERALDVGEKTGLIPSVITFDAHPLSLVTGSASELISSAEDRAGLIERIFGIDDVIILHFDAETAQMPWDEFVERLAEEFGARHLIAGHDFTFGHKGSGNAQKLLEKCLQMNIGCDIIPPVMYRGTVSSSTHIRKLLKEGEIELANEFLGHPYVLTDYVHYGYKLGRTLGTPTINMCFGDGVLVPAHGVYATRVHIADGVVKLGVTNIGTRPTVSGVDSAVTAEKHILDYRKKLYGRTVRLEFYSMIRTERKFSDKDALREQILMDCESVRKYFGEVN